MGEHRQIHPFCYKGVVRLHCLFSCHPDFSSGDSLRALDSRVSSHWTFPDRGNPAFGVLAVFSLSVWGGVWVIIFALVDNIFPRNSEYWVTAPLFGAILPSLVGLIVLLPVKGKPMGGGWHGY